MYKNAHFEYRGSNFSYALHTAFLAFTCCALSIAFGAIAHAQTATGQFKEQVFNGNRAVLVGSQMTLTNPQSGQCRTVNLVTKSGTNSYHGALCEGLHNNVFDARNSFTNFKANG
jgi:hypothetical protein